MEEETLKLIGPLALKGVVETVPAPNTFTCEGLSGLGTGKFLGLNGNGYVVFVLRAGAAGAAPQGEIAPITGYTAGGALPGLVAHDAFSVALAPGNEIMFLHPALAAMLPRGGILTGLFYHGRVTAVPGANRFSIPSLAGHGIANFAGATNPYYAYVQRDAGGLGGAPQGECQAITTYLDNGDFTTAAFTGAVGVGDDMLILHPAIGMALAAAPIANRLTSELRFKSLPQETLTIPAVAADTAVPSIVVGTIPAGAAVVQAAAWFKYRKLTAAAASALAGAQTMQIQKGAGGWNDAINFIDNQYTLAAAAEEGGDVIFGIINLAAVVTGNDTYNFRWHDAVADSALVFTGIQLGLEVVYR
jgi:hypothetical protein